MAKLYLTRHGETEWNTQKIFQGSMDSNLTDLGKQQAKWLSLRLQSVEFDVIYTSSLGRALDTAKIIRGNRNVEIIESEAIKEMNLGIFEGKPKYEVAKVYVEEINNLWNHPHLYIPIGGETFESLKKRSVEFIEGIIAKHQGKNILVVTHGITLKIIMTYFQGKELKDLWEPPFMGNTSLNIVEAYGDKREIVLYADTSHYVD